MPEKAPSPRRTAYLRTVRREKRRVRIWQIALVAGLFAVWELSCRLGLSDGFLVSSPSRMVQTLWRALPPGRCWARPSPWPCGGRTPPPAFWTRTWWC